MQIKMDTTGLRLLKKKLKKVKIKVGLPKGTPNHKSGVSIIEIGTIHEFGSDARHIPERSFIRSTMNEQKANYFKLAQAQGVKIIEGTQSIDKSTETLGIWGQREIIKKFRDNDWAPNAPFTVALKGSSTPLIDTGQLRQSITWSVEK